MSATSGEGAFKTPALPKRLRRRASNAASVTPSHSSSQASIRKDSTTNSSSIANNSGTFSPPPPLVFIRLGQKRKADEMRDIGSAVKSCIAKSTFSALPSKKRLKIRQSPVVLSCGYQSADDGCDDRYEAPDWESLCAATDGDFTLEIVKGGVMLDTVTLNAKPHWVVGRGDDRALAKGRAATHTRVDIATRHPTCSRLHAVIQHKKRGKWFIYDMGSVHLTKVNHSKIFPHKYYPLKNGDIIMFGTSTRMYVFNDSRAAKDESSVSVSSMGTSEDDDDPYSSGLHERRPSVTPPPSPLMGAIRNTSPSQFPFDTKKAATNPRTEDMWIQLQTQIQCQKQLRKELLEASGHLKSDATLTEAQLKKVDRISQQIFSMEDTIEDLKQEVHEIQKNERQRELDRASREEEEDGDEVYSDALDTRYFDDDGLTDAFHDEVDSQKRKRTLKRKRNRSSVGGDDDDSGLRRQVVVSSLDLDNRRTARGFSFSLASSVTTTDSRSASITKTLSVRSSDSAKLSSSTSDYDSYNRRLEELQLRRAELSQGIRDIKRRLQQPATERSETSSSATSSVSSTVSSEKTEQMMRLKQMEDDLEKVRREEMKTLAIVQRLKPAYFKVLDSEPEFVHHKSKRKVAPLSPKRKAESSQMLGSLGAFTEELRRQRSKGSAEVAESSSRRGKAAPVSAVTRTSVIHVRRAAAEGKEATQSETKAVSSLEAGFMAELKKRYKQ